MPERARNDADVRLAGPRQWLGLSVLVLAVFLLAVDATVLFLAIPSLSAHLEPSPTQLLWIGDIYSFALAGLLVTMGNLGDRVGRKRVLLIGAAGFGLVSLLAAFAPTAGWLIVARALLGIAGATLMPSTLAIIRNLFANARQRTTAIAVWATVATAGAAVGPLVGGLLLEHFWWGSVFLMNLPVMMVLLVAGRWLLPESRIPDPEPLDVPSAGLSAVAILAFVYAIKDAAGEAPSVVAAWSALLGVGATILFVRRQRRLSTPLLDVTLFRIPAFAGAVIANVLSMFALTGVLFFLSQYFQLVLGLGPFEAGAWQSPMSIATAVAAVFVGRFAARLGRGRAIGTGLILAAAGVGFIASVSLPNFFALGAALAAVGFGVGLALTLTTDAVVSAASPERAGAASAVSETAYELGAALGIALLGSLHAALYRTHLELPAKLPEGDLADTARESLAAATAAATQAPAAVGDPLLAASRAGFTDAMQLTFVITAVLLACAGAVAWRHIQPTSGKQ